MYPASGPRVGKVRVEDPLAVPVLDRLHAGVAADMSVALGPQGDDAGGELSGGLAGHRAVHDRARPLAIQVEIVPGGVEVPGAHPRRATADLGELQPLGSEEPLHVRRARADPERLDDPLAHLTQLLVSDAA